MASSSSSFIPIKLSSNDKDKLENLKKDLNKIEWEKGEYFFHNFVDYYQLPQIIHIEQTWKTNFIQNQSIYLQTLFDRYLIIASSLTTKNKLLKQKYLIPDWFQGECRILSKNPILKKRWWVFQGAFELYRFDLPRSIKILSDTPAHMKITDSLIKYEWTKIVLRKNACFNVIRREQYQSRVKNDQDELNISEPKEAFVIEDLNNNEFIIPPGVPLRFATLIEDQELHKQYQNHDGTFTIPEIMMRYEFPIDIEILTHLPVDLPDFKSQIQLEKFCVAKSILAYIIDNEQTKIVELSPLTQFTIHCAKCLTYGLPQEGENLKDEKFNEKEYQRYEDMRSKMNNIFDDTGEIYRSKIQLGSIEEIECVEAAYEISMKMKNDDEKPLDNTYLTLDEALKVIKQQVKDEIPFPKTQPERFTVHASTDPSNPYNEVIDFKDMDALNLNNDETVSETLKKDSNKLKSSNIKSQQSKKRQTLVVQQLPPPILLSPESFEKTVRAIPEKLYTEFLPATTSKKSEKTEEMNKSSRQNKKS